jgi:hypothetical protein
VTRKITIYSPNKDTVIGGTVCIGGVFNAQLNLLGESNMAIYQCFFFSNGRISYWENIECDGRVLLTAALRERLKKENWESC